MNILCIIPARSGSKGLKDKNILDLKGLPMMVWSIKQAQKSKFSKDMRIILSTDSEKYRQIGIKYGVEAPFLRPKEISGDLSTDYECISHCVNFLLKEENYKSDIILQLRPTYPTRTIETLDNCISKFMEIRKEYDSLRTVIPFEKSPFKMYTIENNILKPLFKEINYKQEILREPYNECRQKLPQTYLHNGCIDIFNTEILNKKTVTSNKIYPYLMECKEINDIDTIEDLELIN